MSTPVDYGPLKEIQMQADEIAVIEAAIDQMPEDGLMVEWGSGGSTIRWLERLKPGQRLISIEHNWDWFSKVGEHLEAIANDGSINLDNFEYVFSPELHGYKHGYANVTEEHPHGLEDYMLPPSALHLIGADLFLVDGIGRAAIAVMLEMKAITQDRKVFLHDYTGREAWYAWALPMLGRIEPVGTTLVRVHPR